MKLSINHRILKTYLKHCYEADLTMMSLQQMGNIGPYEIELDGENISFEFCFSSDIQSRWPWIAIRRLNAILGLKPLVSTVWGNIFNGFINNIYICIEALQFRLWEIRCMCVINCIEIAMIKGNTYVFRYLGPADDLLVKMLSHQFSRISFTCRIFGIIKKMDRWTQPDISRIFNKFNGNKILQQRLGLEGIYESTGMVNIMAGLIKDEWEVYDMYHCHIRGGINYKNSCASDIKYMLSNMWNTISHFLTSRGYAYQEIDLIAPLKGQCGIKIESTDKCVISDLDDIVNKMHNNTYTYLQLQKPKPNMRLLIVKIHCDGEHHDIIKVASFKRDMLDLCSQCFGNQESFDELSSNGRSIPWYGTSGIGWVVKLDTLVKFHVTPHSLKGIDNNYFVSKIDELQDYGKMRLVDAHKEKTSIKITIRE